MKGLADTFRRGAGLGVGSYGLFAAGLPTDFYLIWALSGLLIAYGLLAMGELLLAAHADAARQSSGISRREFGVGLVAFAGVASLPAAARADNPWLSIRGARGLTAVQMAYLKSSAPNALDLAFPPPLSQKSPPQTRGASPPTFDSKAGLGGEDPAHTRPWSSVAFALRDR